MGKSVHGHRWVAAFDVPFGGETVSFSNTPLTDVTVTVDSQVDGGTSSTIVCDGSSASTDENGDGSLALSDREPGTHHLRSRDRPVRRSASD
jgi:hypothetical protein